MAASLQFHEIATTAAAASAMIASGATTVVGAASSSDGFRADAESCGVASMDEEEHGRKLATSKGSSWEWAIVFRTAREEHREGTWRVRTGPEQIEFVDAQLASVVRGRWRNREETKAFEQLEVKIFERWLDYRVAVLNSLLELLALPFAPQSGTASARVAGNSGATVGCGLRCELYQAVGEHGTTALSGIGWCLLCLVKFWRCVVGLGGSSSNLLVLVHLPERVARSYAVTQGYQLPLNADVPEQCGLPQWNEKEIGYAGYARFDDDLAAHYSSFKGKGKRTRGALYKDPKQGGGLFSMVDRVRLMHHAVEEHVDLNSLVCLGVITTHFPLHNAQELEELTRLWARPAAMCSKQPLSKVHAYFGDQVAFYFAWLGFQAKFMIPLAIIGAFVEALVETCPCAAWSVVLHSTCGCVVVVWATVYLRLWRRQESSMRGEWAAADSLTPAAENPNYQGSLTTDPVTGQQIKREGVGMKMLRRVFSLTVTVIFICSSAGIVACINLLKVHLEHGGGITDMAQDSMFDSPDLMQDPRIRINGIITVLNAAQILSLETIWRRVSPWLVELENHRTLERRQNALIWKLFLFRAINAFGASFWIAFCKQRDQCDNQDCMGELRFQIATVFLTYSSLTVLTDVVFPWLWYHLQLFVEDQLRPPDEKIRRQRSFIERQFKMADYDWTASAEDYMAVVLQTGLVLLFFSVLPSVALMALVAEQLQIRSHAWKLCHTHRRPFPAQAPGVGAWNEVMELLMRLAVVVNAGLVIFTSGLQEHRTPAERWLMFVLAERTAMILVSLVWWLIPDTTHEVQIGQRRHRALMERLREEQIRCEKCARNAAERHPPLALGDNEDSCCRSSGGAFGVPRFDLSKGKELRSLSDQILAPHLRTPRGGKAAPQMLRDGRTVVLPGGGLRNACWALARGRCFGCGCLRRPGRVGPGAGVRLGAVAPVDPTSAAASAGGDELNPRALVRKAPAAVPSGGEPRAAVPPPPPGRENKAVMPRAGLGPKTQRHKPAVRGAGPKYFTCD